MAIKKKSYQKSVKPQAKITKMKLGSRRSMIVFIVIFALIGVYMLYFANAATTGRSYPLHTDIVATTFWVGETFRDAPDGDQTCSAYDGKWAEHWGALGDTLGNRKSTSDCGNVPYGGCDSSAKAVSDTKLTCGPDKTIRKASNNYLPDWATESKMPRENHFYLDLPYDDINVAKDERCKIIPWANDPGYKGNCTNSKFSYMKNRWVKLTKGDKVCYGQIQDAGPADDENPKGQSRSKGKLLYRDAPYVFGVDVDGNKYNDVRPDNLNFGPTSKDGAGVDVSPALNGCLGFKDRDGNSDRINWQWVDAVDVPKDGPWAVKVTTSQVDGVPSTNQDYINSLMPGGGAIITPKKNNNPTFSSFSSPQKNKTINSAQSVQLDADAVDSDGDITEVAFYQNGVAVNRDTTKPYNFIVQSPPVGNNSYWAIATDNDGGTAKSSGIAVTVAQKENPPKTNKLPEVTLKSDQNGKTINSPGTVKLDAKASDEDGTIKQVVFYRDEEALFTDTTSPYTYMDTGVVSGTHKYFVVASDNGGATTKSSPSLSVIVKGTTPQPNDTTSPTPITGITTSLSFDWGYKLNVNWNKSTDNSGSVSYIIDWAESSGLATTNNNFYKIGINSVKPYTIKVQAVDPSGNKSAVVQNTVTPKCFLIWCWL